MNEIALATRKLECSTNSSGIFFHVRYVRVVHLFNGIFYEWMFVIHFEQFAVGQFTVQIVVESFSREKISSQIRRINNNERGDRKNNVRSEFQEFSSYIIRLRRCRSRGGWRWRRLNLSGLVNRAALFFFEFNNTTLSW